MLAGNIVTEMLGYSRKTAVELWRAYERELGKSRHDALYTLATQEFGTRGYHFGQLPLELARRAAEVVSGAELQPLRSTDYTPGFATENFTASVVEKINKGSRFRVIRGARCTWLLADVLDNLSQEVGECLGSPWRVLAVRAWSTPPNIDPDLMYDWHTDGMVPEVFKVMLYLTPLTDSTGAIEFKTNGSVLRQRSAEPGAWVLFRNSEIEHRGAPGTIAERLALEVTLCRSATFDLRPRYPGLNAHYPLAPWIDTLDGCDVEIARRVATRDVRFKPSLSRTMEDALLKGVEASLYAIAPLTKSIAKPIATIAPGLAKRLRNLERRARERTLRQAAEVIVIRLLRSSRLR